MNVSLASDMFDRDRFSVFAASCDTCLLAINLLWRNVGIVHRCFVNLYGEPANH